MAQALTVKSVRDFVRNSLGYGAVEVELLDKHIDTAITRAVNSINAYTPRRFRALLPNQSGGRYWFTDQPNPPAGVVYVPGLQAIIDVAGVRATLFSTPDNRIDLFDPLVYIGGLGAGAGRLNVTGFRQSVEYLDSVRDIFGSGLTFVANGWRYEETISTRVYELYVDIRASTRITYGYEASLNITPDDDVRTGIWSVPEGQIEWFERYVLAVSKTTLARVRGKFQGIPTPDGVDMTLDQNELGAEGKEEIDRLDVEIREMRKQTPIIIA